MVSMTALIRFGDYEGRITLRELQTNGNSRVGSACPERPPSRGVKFRFGALSRHSPARKQPFVVQHRRASSMTFSEECLTRRSNVGSFNVTVVPRPTIEDMSMRPPDCAANPATAGNPMPDSGECSFVVKNGVTAMLRTATSIPVPSSTISSVVPSVQLSRSTEARKSSRPPSGIARLAFITS